MSLVTDFVGSSLHVRLDGPLSLIEELLGDSLLEMRHLEVNLVVLVHLLSDLEVVIPWQEELCELVHLFGVSLNIDFA